MASSGEVDFSLAGGVALIELDDGKANALSHERIAQIRQAFARARKDAKAVVLTGRTGRFSAGFDLATMTAGPHEARALVEDGCHLLLDLYVHPQPFVIACTGHALAAGALLLLTADHRIGADGDFKIGLNEVAIGLRLPIFALELARDRLSPRHFAAATTLAQVYTPEQAREVGYLDEVVDVARLREAALAKAETLLALSGKAFEQTKALARRALADRVRSTLTQDMQGLAPPQQPKRNS